MVEALANFIRQLLVRVRSSGERGNRRSLACEPLEARQVLAVTVEGLTPTPSGFAVQVSEEIRSSILNLYDAQNGALGAADVRLTGASVGEVSGSLVVDGEQLHFVATGGTLAPDDYTVTIRSA
ncbi:MAG: hypothetical protein AB7F89_24640, partial [Pirellulaceae bacterium]